MDNRFRNAVTCVPSVRISVSRQGLSTTIGMDGSTVWRSVARGHEDGLRVIGDRSLAGPLPTDQFLIPGTRMDFGTGAIGEMTSPGLEGLKALLLATSRRKREIIADARRARVQVRVAWCVRALGWATLAAVLPPVRKGAQNKLAKRRTELSTLNANLETSAIAVDFDMESAVSEPHRHMREAFGRMMECGGKWSISSSQRIDSVKARTTAAFAVGRQAASLGHGADPLVRTSELPLAMSVQGGRSTAYFYPGFILVAAHDGRDFALIDLVDLKVDARAITFMEDEAVPSDATVVGATWAKSNKDGSRDRRFAHNRQLPVASYGELTLAAASGLNEAFMTSRAEPCHEFVSAVRDLQRTLSAARGARKIEARKAIAGQE